MTVRGKKQKNEAAVAASRRSRKSGQLEQDKLTLRSETLLGHLREYFSDDFIQLEVEPTLKHLKKLSKKKLN